MALLQLLIDPMEKHAVLATPACMGGVFGRGGCLERGGVFERRGCLEGGGEKKRQEKERGGGRKDRK